jgi:HK97 family phage major capsid protein
VSTVITEKDYKALLARQENTDKALQGLTKSLDSLVDKLSRSTLPGHPSPGDVFGVPHARRGEDPLSSRGFSFCKMLGLMSDACEPDDAKIEVDISNRIHSACNKSGDFKWGGLPNLRGRRFLAPLASSFFPMDMVGPAFRHEMKSLVLAGTDGSMDLPDETRWMRRKALEQQGYGAKALSWLLENTGGSLVAPPEMGELIELLRNKEALVNAGARVIPLPPQGRLKFPRQTSPSSTYWVGENAGITESTIGTGEVTLQAKKLAVLIKAPNELIRFASPAAEALLRDDMTKSLALGLDLAGLEGSGTDTRPRGVLNYPNINRLNSSQQTTTGGDYVKAEDIYRMIAIIEENNAEFEAFIMRPKTLYKYYQLRADAIGQGDRSGMFLLNLIREAGDGTKPMLGGYPVVKSTQVSQVQSKVLPSGNSTPNNLTYVTFGMWSDMLIGMFGAIEFAATTQGDTSFTNDQTWVRGILSADIQLRHENAFGTIQFLDTSL